jgi:hypothetical protein
MNVDEIRRELGLKGIFPLRLGAVIVVSGLMMVMIALVVEIALASTVGDYYSFSKATRDAAPAGGELLRDLGVIGAVNTWVLPFKFLGLATLIASFGLIFSVILRSVRLRAATMAAVLPAIKARAGSAG